LGQRDLQAGNQVAEHGFCRKTDGEASESGRRQQAGTELTHRGKGHQRHADTQNHGDHAPGATQHACLCLHAARTQVVFQVDRIEARHRGIERADAADDEPCTGNDEGEAEDMLHAVDERRGLVGRGAERD
jgi:hypothetical protein